MKIVSTQKIGQKIKRLAIEILENHHNTEHLIIAGINNNGFHFANLLQQEIEQKSNINIQLTRIRINPAAPLNYDVTIQMDQSEIEGKPIIIVDDVANTGRTLFYAFKVFMNVLPSKVEIAVLVDRKHKSFPVEVNYVGLSLATTLKNNIQVDLTRLEESAVYLS